MDMSNKRLSLVVAAYSGASPALSLGSSSSLYSTSNVKKELFQAVTKGDYEQVESIISNYSTGPNKKSIKVIINEKDSDDFCVLHRACASGEVSIMKLLLDNGADPNVIDGSGDTPLHWACFCGNLEAVDILLKYKADPLKPSTDGKTSLDAALEEKHTHILQLLFAQPNVFDRRAIMGNVIIEGYVYIKSQSKSFGRKIWRLHGAVLSSMVRSLFIWKGKEQTDAYADVVHFEFQDILCVRMVNHTNSRYQNRRFNVYVRATNPSLGNFSVASSGLDSLNDDDIQVFDNAAKFEQDKNDSDLSSKKSNGYLNESNAQPTSPLNGLSSFMKRLSRAGGNKNSSASSSAAASSSTSRNGLSHHSRKSSRNESQLSLRSKGDSTGPRTFCVSFLVETAKEANKWMEALKFAGMAGKSMAAVRIQTKWRAYKARKLLIDNRRSMKKGSEIAQRRGKGDNHDPFYVPLKAEFADPSKASWAAAEVEARLNRKSQAKKGANNSQLVKRNVKHSPLFSVSTAELLSKATGGRVNVGSAASKDKDGLNGINFKIEKKSTLELAPVVPVFHNGNDIQGWLLKQSREGVSGAMKLWKKRYFILSHTQAELQYFDPSQGKKRQIRRIPFSKILQVLPWKGNSERDFCRFSIRVMGGETFDLEAVERKDAERWINAINSILPLQNVAAVKIQKITRGFIARIKFRKLKRKIQSARMKKQEEVLARIEAARQRGIRESELRMAREELEILSQAAEDEKRFRERRHAEAKAKTLSNKSNGEESSGSTISLLKQIGSWQEYHDSKSNRTFYYNKDTKEKQWDLPIELSDYVSLSESEIADNRSEYDEEDIDDGENNYSSEKRKSDSLINKSNSLISEGSQTTEGKGSKKYKMVQVNNDWEQLYDANSGNYYYYNRVTRETTWDMPDSFAKRAEKSNFDSNRRSLSTSSMEISNASDSDRSKQIENGNSKISVSEGKDGRDQSDAKKKKKKRRESSQIINGWERHVHASSGKEFYVNINTGEKTWKKPIEFESKQTKTEPSKQEVDPSLAWVEAKTDEGKKFYYNTITNESRWDLPSNVITKNTKIPINWNNTENFFGAIVEFILQSGAVIKSSVQKEEFYVGFRSGVLFCWLINSASPGLIEEAAINAGDVVDILPSSLDHLPQDARDRMITRILENHNLALESLKSIGRVISKSINPHTLMGPGLVRIASFSLQANKIEEYKESNAEKDHQIAITDLLWEIFLTSLSSTQSIKEQIALVRRAIHSDLPLDGQEDVAAIYWLKYHLQSSASIPSDLFSKISFYNFGGVGSDALFPMLLANIIEIASSTQNLNFRFPAPKAIDDFRKTPDNILSISSNDIEEISKYITEFFISRRSLSKFKRLPEFVTIPDCIVSEDKRMQLSICYFAMLSLEMNSNRMLNEALLLDNCGDYEKEERIFRTWINSLEINASPDDVDNLYPLTVNSLFHDLQDGLILNIVINRLFYIGNKRITENELTMYQSDPEASLSISLKLLQQQTNENIGDVSASAVLTSEESAIVKILWIVYRLSMVHSISTLKTEYFQDFPSRALEAYENEILQWANERVRIASLSILSASNSHSEQSSLTADGQSGTVTFSLQAVKSDSSSSSSSDQQGMPSPIRPARSSLRLSSSRSSISRKLTYATTTKEIQSFGDVALRDCMFLMKLLDSVKPGIVNWSKLNELQKSPNDNLSLSERDSVDFSKSNDEKLTTIRAKILISLTKKLGIHVTLSLDDILNVNQKAMSVYMASLMQYALMTSRSSS